MPPSLRAPIFLRKERRSNDTLHWFQTFQLKTHPWQEVLTDVPVIRKAASAPSPQFLFLHDVLPRQFFSGSSLITGMTTASFHPATKEMSPFLFWLFLQMP